MDLVAYAYKATIRFHDGSLVPVEWVKVTDPSAEALPFPHPFMSAFHDENRPFDDGSVGEIPQLVAERSPLTIPDWVCRNCWVGDPDWWLNGWPVWAPIPPLLDGWPTWCDGGFMPVTYVGLSLPAEFVVTGSPVTTMGTLTGDWVSQTQHHVFAAPSGSSGIPGFRLLEMSDLPAGIGTVSSVAMTVPSWLSVTGSPITTSGTLAVDTVAQSGRKFLASPSDGSSGTLSPRAIVAADIPALSYGTVSSVTIAVPSFMSQSGSPITTSGTITLSFSNQSGRKFLASPSDGSSGAMDVRAVVNDDLPTSGATAGTYGTTTKVAQVTVNDRGIVTGIAEATIAFPATDDKYLHWELTTLNYTDFQVAATTKTVTIRTLAAGECLHLIKSILSTAWTMSAGTVTATWGYNNGEFATATNATKYNAAVPLSPQNLTPSFTSSNQPDCQGQTQTWNVTMTCNSLGGNLSNLTAGQIKVWLLIGKAA